MCYRTKKLNTAKGQIDHNFGNFTDTKRISQEFSDCGLHNDKYTKFQLCEKYRLRDNHIKGTSHRKEESDLV